MFAWQVRGNHAIGFAIKTSAKWTLHVATGDAVAYNGSTGLKQIVC